jgi:hypothetical protein
MFGLYGAKIQKKCSNQQNSGFVRQRFPAQMRRFGGFSFEYDRYPASVGNKIEHNFEFIQQRWSKID